MTDEIDLTKPTRYWVDAGSPIQSPTPEQVRAAEERGRQLMEVWRKKRLAADDWRHVDTRKDE